MSVLVRDVLLNGKTTDIYIEGNLISSIDSRIQGQRPEYVIDGRGKAALPGFVNAHTHSAMALLRSYADDLALHEWLEKHIWPVEAKMSSEDVYWGVKLACLEMIKTGTTCFFDMYAHAKETAKAADEMGLRAVVSEVFFDFLDPDRGLDEFRRHINIIRELREEYSSRITPALGPHAVYTVSVESLKRLKEYADCEGLLMHFHLAETLKENIDFIERYGMKPVPFLEEIGFLGSNLVAAHGIWFDRFDVEVLARNGVNIVYNPVSNMKLASGVLPYRELKSAGVNIALGTDGCASNNCLDMFESMKFAALLQKSYYSDPTLLSAGEVYMMATVNGARALRLNCGVIEPGRLADLILVDLRRPELRPQRNLQSNLVYSAKGCCVDTVICDGRIIMQDRYVEGEEEILDKVEEVAECLYS